MPNESAQPVDVTDEEHREVGRGTLTDETGPSTALAHLYRGELHRMRVWRERLDQTTYWAIVIMSGVLTWTFTSRDRPHYLLLIGAAALTTFLFIEARRFRGYDVWRGRVRTLQRNVFAYGLDPSLGISDTAWRRELGEDYIRPTVKISAEEAIAHRLRRVYLALFSITLAAWIVRVAAFASDPFPASAGVGDLPGLLVTGLVAVWYLAAVVIAVRPRTWVAEDELHVRSVGEHR